MLARSLDEILKDIEKLNGRRKERYYEFLEILEKAPNDKEIVFFEGTLEAWLVGYTYPDRILYFTDWSCSSIKLGIQLGLKLDKNLRAFYFSCSPFTVNDRFGYFFPLGDIKSDKTELFEKCIVSHLLGDKKHVVFIVLPSLRRLVLSVLRRFRCQRLIRYKEIMMSCSPVLDRILKTYTSVFIIEKIQ